MSPRELRDRKKLSEVVGRAEMAILNGGGLAADPLMGSEEMLSHVAEKCHTYAVSTISHEFIPVARAVHNFYHTDADTFFARRKRKKSFQESKAGFLGEGLNGNRLPSFISESGIISFGEKKIFREGLSSVSTAALVEKHDAISWDLLHQLHANDSMSPQRLDDILSKSYLLDHLSKEIVQRVGNVDEDAMDFVASRPDATWELAKKEKEVFGVNKIRPEKLLTAEEAMEYTELDEDEFAVCVWGEMVEARTRPDSRPIQFGWEKPRKRESELADISEEEKANIMQLLYPAWSVLELSDIT